MREHEVPTHVQAEDKVLLGFTFPQIVALTAVCALSCVMTLWRWRYDGIRPNFRNLLAFQELAKSMGLGHLLPTIEVRYVPVRTGRPFPG